MSFQTPKIIVLSAPSGSGKNTVYEELVKLMPDSVDKTISYTTRDPRGDEVHGIHYVFTDAENFKKILENNGMAEYTKYGNDRYYGTPASAIEKIHSSQKHAVLIIEVKGAMQIKQKYPDSITIMIMPPDKETLEFRLRDRSTESEEAIQKRLKIAREEVPAALAYDYIVINHTNQAAECAAEIKEIIESPEALEKHKACNYTDFIENFFNLNNLK